MSGLNLSVFSEIVVDSKWSCENETVVSAVSAPSN